MWMVAARRRRQVVIGDLHGLNTIHHPADEGGGDGGAWETTRGMHMLLFAIPDQAAATSHYEIGIPQARQPDPDPRMGRRGQGADEVPPEDRPPVAIVFYAFRVMVGIGVLLAPIGLLSLWLRWQGRAVRQPGSPAWWWRCRPRASSPSSPAGW